MTAEQHATFRQPARLRIEDFELLQQSGSFDQYKRTELLDGAIYIVNAMFSRHAWAVKIMTRRIDDALEQIGSELTVLPDASVSMPPHNLPQPDLAVTSAKIERAYVPVASVALIVEVADSSVRDDLGLKAHIYAEQGVPEYWVVDLPGGKLHQFWSPTSGGYEQQRSIALGEAVTSITLPQLCVQTDRVLSG